MARVLVTRPEPGASATARRLVAAGHQPVVLPLSEIHALSPELPSAGTVDIVAATSANALRHLPPVPAALLGRPCYTVGARTAEEARRAGFTDVRAADGDGAALAAMIVATERGGTTVLYLCGRVRRPEFERSLEQAGIAVHPVEIYDTRFLEPGLTAINHAAGGRPIDAVLLYSAETARVMASIIAAGDPANLFAEASLLCLSAQVAAALETLGSARTYVPMVPTEDGLLALIPGG